MNCEQMLELLSARLDGELNQTEEQAVQAHLEQCPECRALWEQLSALQFSLEDLEILPAPEEFAQGVMARVRQESRRPKVVPLWKHRQVRALVGVAACAALFVGLGSIRMGSSKEAAAPMAAAPEAAMYYSAAETESAGEYGMDYAKMAPMEPMAPAADAAPAAPEENPMGAICESGVATEDSMVGEILLPRLPEGLEEKIGPLHWEERAEDGALCAELTADEAELVLELASEQGMDGVCVGYPGGNEERWILVLQPN